jgi:excisionase family DNA binding protein
MSPFPALRGALCVVSGRGVGVWTHVETEVRSEEALLTPEELAQYLKCSRTFVYSILARGDIPSLKLGKLRRIRRQDAEFYIEKKVSGGYE